MNHGRYRALTGVDYEVSRPRRKPRGLQVLLGLVAVSAFGSAWLLRDEASASAADASAPTFVAQEADALKTAGVILPLEAAQTPVAAVPIEDKPLEAREATPVQLAATTSVPVSAPPTSEAAAIQAPAVAETPDAKVVDSLTDQIEKKPEKKKLTLPAGLKLRSSVVLVVDQNTHEVMAAQNADMVRPIASLTKLMTALVVSEAKLPMDEVIQITRDDIDLEKHSYSRLSVGLKFTRKELLLLALMSSENRAASALGRSYPGGREAFIRAMNAKARQLGMNNTHFVDSSGLSSGNVSTAHDLVKLAQAAYKVPMIRDFSTEVEHTVKSGKRALHYVSSNRLVRAKNDWRIGMQKTGFTNEAGRCLVMQATVNGRPLMMVLLNADSAQTRFADAQRVRNWVEGRHVASTKSTTSNSKSSKQKARASSAS